MIHSIGNTAGKVWEYLNKKGEANIVELLNGVVGDASLIYLALGWLAREDKLRIEMKGHYITYSLKG
jgi:hypothetical protein